MYLKFARGSSAIVKICYNWNESEYQN